MRVVHDFHIHTNLSLCAEKDTTVEYYVHKAEEIGLKKIGFANHLWDGNIECAITGIGDFYTKQNPEYVEQLREELATVKSDTVKTYFGCEVEYDLAHRGPSITEEVAERFDYILVPNSHTHMVMPKECFEPWQKHADFMVQAYEDIINSNVSRYITAMAHPFEAVNCPHYSALIDLISDDRFKYLFHATAKKNIAVEINIGNYHEMADEDIVNCSQIRMFRLAKECGCKFIFGSDSHNRRRHSSYGHADVLADILELKENDIIDIAR